MNAIRTHCIVAARLGAIGALLTGAGITPFGAIAQAASPATAPQPIDADVQVLPVSSGVFMLTVGGVNVTVQTGTDGTVVVDPGPVATAPAVVAQIRRLTRAPIRYVIDTNADAEVVGGNAIAASAGSSIASRDLFAAAADRQFSSIAAVPGAKAGNGAPIIALQSVLTRMLASTPGYPASGLPTDTFTRPEFNFFANEGIAVVQLPAAHSDADAAVRFERTDVVVTGAVFDPTRFPAIDLQHGGSIQGELDALNRIVNTLVFAHTPVLTNTGGTLVVPLRGPLCDLADLVTYQDMVATVTARIRFYMDRGRSLRQVLAADPLQGYRTRYGADRDNGTATDFVAAVYRSLLVARLPLHRQREP